MPHPFATPPRSARASDPVTGDQQPVASTESNRRARQPAAWAAQTRIGTPLGTLTLVATPLGLAGAWFDGQKHHPGALALPVEPEHPQLKAAARAFAAYWANGNVESDGADEADEAIIDQPYAAEPHPLASLALDPQGTPFQKAVWAELRRIAAGEVVRYGDIAAALGRPTAARAVGAAVGRNPISVLVPCHRVVGSDGGLTGYAGGLERKRALLEHEQRSRPQKAVHALA